MYSRDVGDDMLYHARLWSLPNVMRIVPNLCCSMNPVMYCSNCKWKICQECKNDLPKYSREDYGVNVDLHHSYHSLCIKRDIKPYVTA